MLHSLAIFSGLRQRKSVGLGALEARWKRASNGPKIIQIDLQILAGDDFEKIFLQRSDEISLILLTFHWNAKDNWVISIDFQYNVMLYVDWRIFKISS